MSNFMQDNTAEVPMPDFFDTDETEQLSPEEQAAYAAEDESPAEQARESEQRSVVSQKRIQALTEERDRERQEKLDVQERWARLDERKRVDEERAQARRDLMARLESETAARVEAADRPDPNYDAQGARLWDNERRLEQIEQERAQERQAYQAWQQQTAQYQQQQAISYEIENWRTSQEAVAKAAHPDYGDAVEYLHKKRVEHWQMMGNPPQEAENMWLRERFAYMAQTKYNQDRGMPARNFGDIVYQLATQVGYRPGAVYTPQWRQPTGQPAQHQQPARKPAPARIDVNRVRSMSIDEFSSFLDRVAPDGDDLLRLQKTSPALYAAISQRMQALG
jgi:hypothetical protein